MIVNLCVKKKKKEEGKVVIMISGGLDKTDIDIVKRKVPCLESHPSAAAEEDGMVTALPQSPSHVVTSRLSESP